MNPVVIAHFVAAIIIVAALVPLIGGRVKMNHWYGIRLPQAFASEERWLEINHFGGQLVLGFGVALGATAFVGAFLQRKDRVTYDWTALVVVLGGLAVVVALIHRHVRKTNNV
jgi:uncharacterized membrane protein